MRYEITNTTLIGLHAKYGGKCTYCGTDTVLLANVPNGASVDHYVPRSEGGSYLPNNKVLSCVSCNSRKGMLSLEEFETYKLIRPGSERLEWVWDELFETDKSLSPPERDVAAISRRYFEDASNFRPGLTWQEKHKELGFSEKIWPLVPVYRQPPEDDGCQNSRGVRNLRRLDWSMSPTGGTPESDVKGMQKRPVDVRLLNRSMLPATGGSTVGEVEVLRKRRLVDVPSQGSVSQRRC